MARVNEPLKPFRRTTLARAPMYSPPTQEPRPAPSPAGRLASGAPGANASPGSATIAPSRFAPGGPSAGSRFASPGAGRPAPVFTRQNISAGGIGPGLSARPGGPATRGPAPQGPVMDPGNFPRGRPNMPVPQGGWQSSTVTDAPHTAEEAERRSMVYTGEGTWRTERQEPVQSAPRGNLPPPLTPGSMMGRKPDFNPLTAPGGYAPPPLDLGRSRAGLGGLGGGGAMGGLDFPTLSRPTATAAPWTNEVPSGMDESPFGTSSGAGLSRGSGVPSKALSNPLLEQAGLGLAGAQLEAGRNSLLFGDAPFAQERAPLQAPAGGPGTPPPGVGMPDTSSVEQAPLAQEAESTSTDPNVSAVPSNPTVIEGSQQYNGNSVTNQEALQDIADMYGIPIEAVQAMYDEGLVIREDGTVQRAVPGNNPFDPNEMDFEDLGNLGDLEGSPQLRVFVTRGQRTADEKAEDDKKRKAEEADKKMLEAMYGDDGEFGTEDDPLKPSLMDEQAVNDLAQKQRERMAFEQSRALIRASEDAARMGMSPEASSGRQAEMAQAGGFASAEAEAKLRFDAAARNQQAKIQNLAQQAALIMQRAQYLQSREAQATAFAQAQALLQMKAQMELDFQKWQAQNQPDPLWGALGSIGGALVGGMAGPIGAGIGGSLGGALFGQMSRPRNPYYVDSYWNQG